MKRAVVVEQAGGVRWSGVAAVSEAPGRRATKAEIDRAIDMYQRGASVRDAARAIGFSRQTVLLWLRARGVARRSSAEGLAIAMSKRPVSRAKAVERFLVSLEANVGARAVVLAKVVRDGLAALPPRGRS